MVVDGILMDIVSRAGTQGSQVKVLMRATGVASVLAEDAVGKAEIISRP